VLRRRIIILPATDMDLWCVEGTVVYSTEGMGSGRRTVAQRIGGVDLRIIPFGIVMEAIVFRGIGLLIIIITGIIRIVLGIVRKILGIIRRRNIGLIFP
jgi:hypothetical protein